MLIGVLCRFMHDQQRLECQTGVIKINNVFWNIKQTLVKIVLSYIKRLDLADKMKRQLDVHEAMALVILAGAFVHGILLAMFAL